MLRFRPALHTLAAALVFSVVSPVSSKELPKVLFQCDFEQHPSICKALVEALKSKAPELDLTVTEVSDPSATEMANHFSGLTLRYHEQSRAKDRLSGQLVWQDQEGQPVDGPLLELSIMDSNLEGQNLTPFAHALIEVSDLPI